LYYTGGDLINQNPFFYIEFQKEPSFSYDEALNLVRDFEDHTVASPITRKNSITVDIDEFRLKVGEIGRLLAIVKNWKTVLMRFRGKKVDYTGMSKILRVFRCRQYRKESPDEEKYCLESGWGCRLLNLIDSSSVEEIKEYNDELVYWFDFGYFEDEETWIIAKEDIREGLKNEIESKNLELCSFFDRKSMERVIRSFPEKINIKEDKRWKIRYQKTVTGNNTLEAVGIKPNTGEEEVAPESENRNIPEVRFSDIGGIDDVIQSIREVIELPLKRPELFHYLGIKPHKGILLFGPPGCGKTMIAKAIANEINAHFIPIKGPELFNKFLGQSEENLRNIFTDARKKQPTIVFFDEIDAVAQTRSSKETLRSESRFVTQLLSLMDGIEDYGKICVIASTNRQNSIDEALLRPGRFDYTIEIDKPTKQGCYDIFRIKTRDMPVSDTMDIRAFTDRLLGLTGAEIDFVVREGAYNCLRRSVDLKKCIAPENNYKIQLNTLRINDQDFEKSLQRVKEMNPHQDRH